MAGANDACVAERRPYAAENYEVYAADVPGFPLQFQRRINALLDRAKPANDCTNETDEGAACDGFNRREAEEIAAQFQQLNRN